MADRARIIMTFLRDAGWANARREPLAGDASARRYERLTDPVRGSAVLMDAPHETGQDVRPFIRIANHLRSLGFSAPHALAKNEARGLLLLEDLGDDLFARIVAVRPDCETALYTAAVDLLASLHQSPVPNAVEDIVPMLAEQATLTYEWYPLRTGPTENEGKKSLFRDTFSQILDRCALNERILILRDFHAENLIWLPDREELARVGLLDFQDALAGPRAYDLVSLLQDARRDVPVALEEAMIRRYLDSTGIDEVQFRETYALLGVQRNLRIVGVFTRLALRDGKTRYVDMIPRVWRYVERNLAKPVLKPLADRLHHDFHQPTPEILTRLREPCDPHRVQ